MKRTLAALTLVLALVGCGTNEAPSGGDPNGNVTIALALNGGAANLNAVAYSVFSTPPPDLATFSPSAATGCTVGGSPTYTTSQGCLPNDGSPVYVKGGELSGSSVAQDVTAVIAGANTSFAYNIALAHGAGYSMAVGGVTDTGSFCYGYTTAPFSITLGQKTTVNLTMKCVLPEASSGFLNVTTTTTYAEAPYVVSFMTGPMSAEAVSGTSGQVVFTLQAKDDTADFLNFHFAPLSTGGATWVGGVHDCNETTSHAVGSAPSCTVTFQCGTVSSTNDVQVEVFNTPTAEASGSLNSPAPTSSTVLDFGNVVCTP